MLTSAYVAASALIMLYLGVIWARSTFRNLGLKVLFILMAFSGWAVLVGRHADLLARWVQ